MDTGLYNITTEEIEFRGGFSADVSPLRSNKGMPIIAVERDDCYQLVDGWGRVSGLLNAGTEYAQAILVSDADLAERSRPVDGDDEDWNRAMWAKYAPAYEYRGTTN